MIPRVIHGATHLLGAPEGWDAEAHGEVRPLHVRKTGLAVLSAWEPTPEELALLLAGGSVVLAVAGPSMPPVILSVQPPPADPAG